MGLGCVVGFGFVGSSVDIVRVAFLGMLADGGAKVTGEGRHVVGRDDVDLPELPKKGEYLWGIRSALLA